MSGPEKFPEALLDQYLTGRICEADRKRLMDWFDRFSDEEVTVELSGERTKEAIRESIWQAIERRTDPESGNRSFAVPKNRSRRRRLLYSRVAAACLVLIALGWWTAGYFAGPEKPTPDRQPRYSAIQESSHNGAVLTLSNGQTVALDSAVEGQIAVQGGAKIIQSGGQVRYLNTGASAAKPGGGMNTMRTPRGKQFSLILPDGTRVWLNAASSITYPVAFAKDRRTVSVTGEVYFEVAHLMAADQKTRVPFEVQSGSLEVDVLGTHFDVENYPEQGQIRTTLMEGSVALHYAKTGRGKVMHPGQQATINRADPARISLAQVDTRQAIAWKDGLFSFKDEPLSDILKQVTRWYDIEASAAPSKLKLRFSGVVSRRARLEDLLNVLSATGVVQFKISDNVVYGY